MQDRFKFRAWDKNENKYIYNVEQIAIPDVMEDFVTLFRSVFRGSNDNLTLEQCTGLKDKNGKLIYEGDIVDDGEQYAEIIFDKSCFCYDDGSGFYEDLAFYHTHCEVIGNIHENSELLEED